MRRVLQQGMLLLGPAMLSALATVLAMSATGPRAVTAGNEPVEEARASAFVLVGPDGTTLARLAAAPAGHGSLTVFDRTGAARIVLGGGGAIQLRDGDGATTRVTLAAIQGNAGVELSDGEGKPRLQLGVSAEQGAGFGVLYADGASAIQLGDRPDLTGLRINDADGNPLATLP